MLTAIEVRNLKPKAKRYKRGDEKGLYLEVLPTGGKYWRMKYYMGGGKERYLSLGSYPEVSLKEARAQRDAARAEVRQGIDPGVNRRLQREHRRGAEANTFGILGSEWLKTKGKHWGHSHASRSKRLIEKDLAGISSRPIKEITAAELLVLLRRIEGRGASDTARRARQAASQVFRFAIASGRAERDPARDLEGALEAPKVVHRAAITDPNKVGPLLRDLWGYQGTEHMGAALKLAPLLFVRPGELRRMEWTELDLADALWTIPSEKMKSRRDHLVPLARQAVEILIDLKPLTGKHQWVFPSGRTPRQPMSDNGVLAALRRLEIPKDVMSGHGFRAMARTILDEQMGEPKEWIEMQLAHLVRDPLGRAYNRSIYLEQRRGMMQRWADYLDGLRDPKLSPMKMRTVP